MGSKDGASWGDEKTTEDLSRVRHGKMLGNRSFLERRKVYSVPHQPLYAEQAGLTLS